MPGLQTTPPGGADRAVSRPLRDLADLECELRRTCERISSLGHRRRAGVRRLAAPGDPMALDSEGAEDDAEREVERLENGSLLDVQLEVGGRRLQLTPCVEGVVEVDAVLGQSRGQRDAVAVRELPQLVLVGHRTGRSARPEEAAAEARALLVGPVDEAHGDGGRPFTCDPAHDLHAGHDVQRAVEPTAVRDRVDVTPDEDCPFRVSAEGEPLVPRFVDLLFDAGSGELLAQPCACALPRLRPSDSLRSVLVAC